MHYVIQASKITQIPGGSTAHEPLLCSMNYVRREGSVQSNHTKRMRRNHVTRMEMEVYNEEMEVEWKWKLNGNGRKLDGNGWP